MRMHSASMHLTGLMCRGLFLTEIKGNSCVACQLPLGAESALNVACRGSCTTHCVPADHPLLLQTCNQFSIAAPESDRETLQVPRTLAGWHH